MWLFVSISDLSELGPPSTVFLAERGQVAIPLSVATKSGGPFHRIIMALQPLVQVTGGTWAGRAQEPVARLPRRKEEA